MNEKLSIVGSLTRHDVRNKVSGITGNAYLLKKKVSDSPEALKNIQNIEHCCGEIEKLLDFVRTYELLGVNKLTFVDLKGAFNEAIKLFSHQELPTIKNNCEGLSVLADSSLTQLFYNLVGNSIKHGKKVSQIEISFTKERDDSLALVYMDDGVGISLDNKERLFRMGFSTSGSTGYGLYLIKKMVDIYGWTIEEAGEPEKGVKFVMNIPAINSCGNECFKVENY